MQQIMASNIIRKTVEIKRHFKSVTNLAKFKRYTPENGTLILQNYMLNMLQLFRSGTNKHSQVTVPGLPYRMVGSLPVPLDPDPCTYGL
jgi:hypothetical protein